MKHATSSMCPHETVGGVCVQCGMSWLEQARQRLLQVRVEHQTPRLSRRLNTTQWATLHAQHEANVRNNQ